VPPKITSSGPSVAGAFQLNGTGPRGSTYHILASTNLGLPRTNWLALTNAVFSGGVFTFTDRQATNYPLRFYQVVTP
jgi:hypothetical protein